jgi:hypothetical protein
MKKTLPFRCLAFAGSRATAGPLVIHKRLVSATAVFADFDGFSHYGDDDATPKD